LRFDVNCSILFTELPLLQRPTAAKAAGFEAVEFWWPFESAVPGDREVDAFLRALGDAGVALAGLNFAAGDMPAGDRGLLSSPATSLEFRDNIDVCVDIAERTGCHRLNALYGNRTDDTDPELAIANLTLAAKAAARVAHGAADGAGAIVLVEALNAFESPRYPLVSSEAVIALLDSVPAGNVAFLADLYHLGRMGEDLSATLTRHKNRIGHIQVADIPGRGAPGTGELDYESVFGQLAEQGYDGWIGLEYKPADPADSTTSFGWLR
jgi:hydroxypyruvate isomerase